MLSFLQSHPYLTIWIILCVFFERVMYCGFVVDDREWFDQHMMPFRKSMKEKKRVTFKDCLHYFKMACYSGAGALKSARQDHAVSLFLHGVACCLIYRATGSLLVALLYLINPVNNQTTIWLNGRRYLVTLVAVLVAWNWWWTAPVMTAWAAWIHVSGVALPLMFLWTPVWPMSGVTAAIYYLFGFKHNKKKAADRKTAFKKDNENQKVHWKKSIIYVKTVGYQFFNCVLPVKPGMYHDFLFYFSGTEQGNKEGYALNFDFWKGVAVLAFLAFDHSVWSFWFLAFISPWCNVYSVTMNASDRYCSIPNVGAMALLVKYVSMLPAPYSIAAISFFAVFYLLKYYPLFMGYRNVENFFIYHINMKPDLVNPRFFLYKFYLQHGDPFQAFGVIRQGLRYRPKDFKLLLGFIECLVQLRKPRAALQAMEFAEQYVPFGEEEDTKKLFGEMRKQHKKEYDEIRGIIDGHKHIHNNGKPYVNPFKKRRVRGAKA